MRGGKAWTVKPRWPRLMEISKATRVGEGQQGAAVPSLPDHNLNTELPPQTSIIKNISS